VNLARLLGVAPDDALRLAKRRFRARFHAVEARHDWSRASLRAADQWIDAVDARGGTEMLEPLVQAAELAPNGIIVLLTEQQEKQFLEACDDWQLPIFATLLLTGLRPSTTGIYGLEPSFRSVPEWRDRITLPQHFGNAGYSTAATGKVFHQGPQSTAPPRKRKPGRKQPQAAAADAEATVRTARSAGVEAWVAGRVEAGPKRVIIEPIGVTYAGEDLHLRG
jgi:hypothetical protein